MAIASQIEVKRKRGRVATKELVPQRSGPGIFYKPTKTDNERVKQLVLLGLTEEAIASYIGPEGIDPITLRRHYGPILKRHRDENLGKIAASIYRQALDVKDGGDPTVSQDQRIKQQHFCHEDPRWLERK